MNLKSERSALMSLIANLPPEVDTPRHAEEEALRLIVRLGLSHPMTLSAALKLVATEMPHGRLGEIERTARALYALLQKQGERKKSPG
jgi:hypothetical protein